MKLKKITNITLICCLFSTLNLSNSFATEVESSYSGLGYINKWEEDIFRIEEGRGYPEVEFVDDKLYIFSGGNMDRYYIPTIEIYDMNNGKPIKIIKIDEKFYGLDTATVGDKIYVSGFLSKDKSRTVIKVLDTKTNSWLEDIDMPIFRQYYFFESVGDKLYLIAGDDENSDSLNNISIYDTKTKEWSIGADIPKVYNIYDISVSDNEIYLLGTNRNRERYGNNVDIYNIEKNEWRRGADMLRKIRESSSEFINGKLYFFGGFLEDDDFNFNNNVDVYDPKTDKWHNIGQASVLGTEFGTTVNDNDEIIIVGGYRHSLYSERIDIFKPFDIDLDEAERLVIKAETSLNFEDISNARDKVNSLENSLSKDILQSRLDKLIPNNMTYEAETVTSNLDVYVKSKNMLVLSLDTNIVEFNDFSGIDDLEKENAITMKVSSSLPYDINVSLETEMTNQKGDKLDNSMLSIKSNNERDYLSFREIKTPLTIIQDQPIGNDVSHNIDLKLNGGLANKSGVYKTSLKFEVLQK